MENSFVEARVVKAGLPAIAASAKSNYTHLAAR